MLVRTEDGQRVKTEIKNYLFYFETFISRWVRMEDNKTQETRLTVMWNKIYI